MMDQTSNRPIRAELVAAKLASARDYAQPKVLQEIEAEPRLVEVLWAIQFFSQPGNYAGGLHRFTADLIEQSLDLIGTTRMREIDGELSADQVREVFDELRPISALDWDYPDLCDADDVLPANDEADYERRLAERRQREAKRSRMVADADRAFFAGLCVNAARENLATYLRELCELPHVRFRRTAERWSGGQAPWYFSAVAEAILRFMDRRAERIEATIAETEITRQMFRWLGKASNTARAVMISGNSRFGKTESLRTWCQMHPGRVRLVNTSSSNSESDLLREVAKALGIELGPKQRGFQLRETLDYVLEHAGLMLVFDEFQFVFPEKYSRNTIPSRLNWVRRSVMDKRVAAAFVCTPQAYQSARGKFVRTTGYAIEQFDERILKTVHLPAELPLAELLAVANIHFPGLRREYLEYVVNQARATERNFVSDIEKIATLAYDNAKEAGRTVPTLADIKAAIADVLPPAPAPMVRAECRAVASPLQGPETADSKPVNRTVKNTVPATRPGVNFDSSKPEEFASSEAL
jgi:hypothetical protein